MINKETILSLFDDKFTLLEWLKKVEDALTNNSLESIEVIKVDDSHAYIKLTFKDGSTIQSPNFELSGGSVEVDTSLNSTSTNPVENRVIYSAIESNASEINGVKARMTNAETDIDTLEDSVSQIGEDLLTKATITSVEELNETVMQLDNEKQDKLSTSSVTSGTLNETLGFDANNNLVRQLSGGSAGTITTSVTIDTDVESIITNESNPVFYSTIKINRSTNYDGDILYLHSAMATGSTSTSASATSFGFTTASGITLGPNYLIGKESFEINDKTYYGSPLANLQIYIGSQYPLHFYKHKLTLIKYNGTNIVSETHTLDRFSVTVTSSSATAYLLITIPKSVNDIVLLAKIEPNE